MNNGMDPKYRGDEYNKVLKLLEDRWRKLDAENFRYYHSMRDDSDVTRKNHTKANREKVLLSHMIWIMKHSKKN